MNTKKLKKIIIKVLPYALMGLVCTNLGEAWRLAEGADASKKLLSFFSTLGIAFSNPLPSFHPVDLLVGAICGGALYLAVYCHLRRCSVSCGLYPTQECQALQTQPGIRLRPVGRILSTVRNCLWTQRRITP